jgi:hypothetical protein
VAAVLPALVAYPLLGIVIAVIGGRLGVILASLGLFLPFSIPAEHTLWRTALTFGTTLFFLRSIDLVRSSRSCPLFDRIWLMFAMWDVRARQRVSRRFELRAFLAFVGYAGVVAAGIALVTLGAPSVDSPSRLALRWLGGALVVYGAADAANALLVAGLGLGGLKPPRQHDAPVLARSVREFWSERWNLNIHAWFQRHTFLPLARRGHRKLGILAAFAASALLHFWLVAVPIGFVWAVPMAAFFLMQGGIAVIETKLSISRWSRPLQHAWTMTALLASSPLFVEPALRVFAA